ncbi:hypothetical protein BD408DRAFT_404746 [Parasitella parasitica]|nr:hypothetical protein BD408DRAFT_404746 [Parasitella parasitica]
MCLFTFTKAQISSIQQIGASLVNHASKVTRFSFATLSLPRAKEGLSLFDPALQANALQWRWLCPLLDPLQITPPQMVSLPYLKSYLTLSLSSCWIGDICFSSFQ